jgi:hypothetical protein
VYGKPIQNHRTTPRHSKTKCIQNQQQSPRVEYEPNM